jgi:hypothetical protein
VRGPSGGVPMEATCHSHRGGRSLVALKPEAIHGRRSSNTSSERTPTRPYCTAHATRTEACACVSVCVRASACACVCVRVRACACVCVRVRASACVSVRPCRRNGMYKGRSIAQSSHAWRRKWRQQWRLVWRTLPAIACFGRRPWPTTSITSKPPITPLGAISSHGGVPPEGAGPR